MTTNLPESHPQLGEPSYIYIFIKISTGILTPLFIGLIDRMEKPLGLGMPNEKAGRHQK